jgi:hypothetical protein
MSQLPANGVHTVTQGMQRLATHTAKVLQLSILQKHRNVWWHHLLQPNVWWHHLLQPQ